MARDLLTQRQHVVAFRILARTFCPGRVGDLMTFEGLPARGEQLTGTYVEDGITATSSPTEWSAVDAAHMDRLGTPFESAIDFAMGSVFIAESVMIRPGGSEYCAADCDNLPRSIWFSGFLNGTLVDSIGVLRAAWNQFETFLLSQFGPIDLLRIEVRNYIDLGLRDPRRCRRARSLQHRRVRSFRRRQRSFDVSTVGPRARDAAPVRRCVCWHGRTRLAWCWRGTRSSC